MAHTEVCFGKSSCLCTDPRNFFVTHKRDKATSYGFTLNVTEIVYIKTFLKISKLVLFNSKIFI